MDKNTEPFCPSILFFKWLSFIFFLYSVSVSFRPFSFFKMEKKKPGLFGSSFFFLLWFFFFLFFFSFVFFRFYFFHCFLFLFVKMKKNEKRKKGKSKMTLCFSSFFVRFWYWKRNCDSCWNKTRSDVFFFGRFLIFLCCFLSFRSFAPFFLSWPSFFFILFLLFLFSFEKWIFAKRSISLLVMFFSLFLFSFPFFSLRLL